MTDWLKQTQQRASAQLAQHAAVPQRYGTAFHLTPPWLDARDIPVEQFKNLSPTLPLSREGATNSPLDKGELEGILLQDNDPYLNWHLSHADQLGLEVIRVPAGTTQAMHWHTVAAQSNSRVILLVLEEEAQLDIQDIAQEQSTMIRRLVVVQRTNSQFNYWAVRSGNTFLTEHLTVHLVGSHAKAEVNHLLVGRAQEQTDMAVRIYHEAPDTESNMIVRAAGYDKSLSIYHGLIDVARQARGTSGYQQGRALLLSPTAIADMLPELAIKTNEVRCSHGVSTLHLDDTALFYLRSRGVPEEQARQLAITGFFHQGLSIPESMAKALESGLATA